MKNKNHLIATVLFLIALGAPSISRAVETGCVEMVKQAIGDRQRPNRNTPNYAPPGIQGSCGTDTSEDPKHKDQKRIVVHVVPLYFPIQNQDPHGKDLWCDVYLDYETEFIAIGKTKHARWVIDKLKGDKWDYRFVDNGIAPVASNVESRSNEMNFAKGAVDNEDKDGDRHAFVVPISTQDPNHRATYYTITVTAFDENGQPKGPCFIRDPIIVNQD